MRPYHVGRWRGRNPRERGTVVMSEERCSEPVGHGAPALNNAPELNGNQAEATWWGVSASV